MSKTIRPNQQTYEALDTLRGRLQATSPVHVSMSATVGYAVRIAFLALPRDRRHRAGPTRNRDRENRGPTHRGKSGFVCSLWLKTSVMVQLSTSWPKSLTDLQRRRIWCLNWLTLGKLGC